MHSQFYNLGGNILKKERYAYTTDATLNELTLVQTIPYVYSEEGWKDKLLAYDGKAITYDTIGDIGNPLAYNGWTNTWKAGQMLSSMTKGDTTAEFTCDHTGLRVKKRVSNVNTFYTLNGKKITHIRMETKTANSTDVVQA